MRLHRAQADVQLVGDLGVRGREQRSGAPPPRGRSAGRSVGPGDDGRLGEAASSRTVTLGAISASPFAAARTACTSSSGPASLSRKSRAPALSAPCTYSSRSNVVITTTAIGSATSGPASCRVASRPSIRACGCRRDRRPDAAHGQPTAVRPSPASPTTSMSRLGVEDHHQSSAHDLLVVGDQDPDRHAQPPSRGRTAVTVQPPPPRTGLEGPAEQRRSFTSSRASQTADGRKR